MPTCFNRQLLLAGAAIGSLACAGTTAPPATTPAPMALTTPTAIAKARADSAILPYTTADIHFMTGMIGHHAQAIAMASLAPAREASPSIQRLASRIINAQHDEIATMQRWLASRNQPVPAAVPGPMRMEMDGGVHEMLMPGMLTEAQMAALQAARGLRFDELFLRGMIQHHRGAIEMVETLFATDGAGQDDAVFKFASDVNVDQVTEIARMERMLAVILFEGRAP